MTNFSPLQAAIVLVSPQLGENIGAIIRIMGNFGFRDMRLVNPRDGWPNEKAKAMAANATEIFANVAVYDNLAEALSGCEKIYACTARMRNINKQNFDLKDHVAEVKNNHNGEKIGIMFGSERCGLLNDEVIYADKIINIPASSEYPVLNLSKAAAFVMYEYFFNFSQDQKEFSKVHRHKKSDLFEVKDMVDRLDQYLVQTNFYKDADRRKKMLENITNIFVGSDLSQQEVRTLNGVFKYLFYYDNSDAKN